MTTDSVDPLAQRKDYGSVSLEEEELLADPIEQIRLWVAEAAAADVYEPNAMVLSTIDPDGAPSSRTVLLRGIDEHGLYFFTDYTSRKGLALFGNPEVSVVFPWYIQHRQILIYGRALPSNQEVSDNYFSGRPRGSQISAWASDQSALIDSRESLESKVREMEARFGEDTEIPRPERWGGFVIEPQRIEFWAGRTSRLHDRIRFTRETSGWSVSRLQP